MHYNPPGGRAATEISPTGNRRGNRRDGELDGPPNTPHDLGDGDYSAGPDYKASCAGAELRREGTPTAKVYFTMDSADSKFYPGNNGGFQRAVTVYVPAQYVSGTPAPVIVSLLERRRRTTNSRHLQDNMIARQALPVMVAVMVMPGSPERGLGIHLTTVSANMPDAIEGSSAPRGKRPA